MVSSLEILKFVGPQGPKSFSPPVDAKEKNASPATWEKTGNGQENSSLQGLPPIHPKGTSEESNKPLSKKKMMAMESPTFNPPKVSSSYAPNGYIDHCGTMTATQLRLAYKGEYNSWKLRKACCKKHGWSWDPAWDEFKDFLHSMGPKSDPTETLDRKDNELKGYGPGLCRWASKTVQNNNKSDNVKITIPVTGEVWTAAKLAKLHKVSKKTIYNWISQ